MRLSRFLALTATGRWLWVSAGLLVLLAVLFQVLAGFFGLTLLDTISIAEDSRRIIAVMTGDQRWANTWITGVLDVWYACV